MSKTTNPTRMPAVFVGHGSPMNAIEDNAWSRAFQALGKALPRPKAIASISAHWLTPGTFATDNERPETIHDFGGFPDALFKVQYPAPGDVKLAERIAALIGHGKPALADDWGLDHGTWSVLVHMFPKADVPVVQISLDPRMPLANHVALGKELAALRDEGVLLLGTGNLTHNLRHAFGAMQTGNIQTPWWAERFDAEIRNAADQHDTGFLTRALETEQGRMAHPTIDHYLPLLYVAGASTDADKVSHPIEGFDWGSLSMRAIQFG